MHLSKLESSSESRMLAIILAVGLLPELAVVIVVARFWLNWNHIPFVVLPYALLGLAIIYFWGVMIPHNVHEMNEQELIIRHGPLFKARIPRSQILTLTTYTGKPKVPMGLFRDKRTGIFFVVAGQKNQLQVILSRPLAVKGLIRNYGYVEQIVFNLDNPLYLLEQFASQEIESLKEVAPSVSEQDYPLLHPATKTSALPTGEPVLSLIKLHKAYNKIPAVHELSLDLFPGELFGLLGSNGAGKTSTLKMISGLLQPTTGEINTYGNSIAYMPEYTVPYERMSGREFLNFLSVLYGIDSVTARNLAENYLERFDLKNSADRIIASYSQGMKRKICLIATLLKGSSILLLDEPTNGMDPAGIIQVKETMRELTGQGKTVIFSTHILDMAERLCDRVGIIDNGYLIFTGSLDELRQQTSMQEASLEAIFLKIVYGGKQYAVGL